MFAWEGRLMSRADEQGSLAVNGAGQRRTDGQQGFIARHSNCEPLLGWVSEIPSNLLNRQKNLPDHIRSWPLIVALEKVERKVWRERERARERQKERERKRKITCEFWLRIHINIGPENVLVLVPYFNCIASLNDILPEGSVWKEPQPSALSSSSPFRPEVGCLGNSCR